MAATHGSSAWPAHWRHVPAWPLPVLAWFLFMTSTSFWLPGHRGETDVGIAAAATATALYAAVGLLAALGVTEHVQAGRHALVSSLPAVAVLAAAAAVGLILNWQRAGGRGEPIFLFFGVALWASWSALVLSTALLSRVRWSGQAGVGVTLLVALLGLFEFTALVD